MANEVFNDFGFTAVDESELTSYQQATEAKEQVQATAEGCFSNSR